MGSSARDYYDHLNEIEADEHRQWLDMLSNDIRNIKPRSSEYADLKWLMNNKEKLIRNRRLIDLIG